MCVKTCYKRVQNGVCVCKFLHNKNAPHRREENTGRTRSRAVAQAAPRYIFLLSSSRAADTRALSLLGPYPTIPAIFTTVS